MIFNKALGGLIVACLAFVAGTGTLRAELPMLTEREWLGYFLAFGTKKYQFGIAPDGKTAVKVIGKNGNPLFSKASILVDFLVEEISPDGSVRVRPVNRDSLESAHPASNKISNAVVRGKVTGDAGFEIFLNEDRGVISLGGRIVDPGTTKNPLRFSIRVRFQESYEKDVLDDKKQIKAFEDKIKNDRLQLIWTDKKRVKPSLFEDVDASSAELNGPGIAAMQLEMSSYQNNRIEIAAAGNSSMKLSNTAPGPLYKGFSLTWSADPDKDPEDKARLMIEVK